MRSRAPMPASFLRTALTYTSTTLLEPSKSSPQTRSRICARVTAMPAFVAEVLQQAKLGRAQRHLAPGDADAARAAIDDEVADRERRVNGQRAAPQQRAHARRELVLDERLDEVVVGAGIEPAHAVFDGVARGEEQHRRRDAFGARIAAEREAVAPGQHDVDDRGVVRAAQQHVVAGLAVRGDVDGVFPAFEHRANRFGDLALIFDHQDAHVSRFAPAQRRFRCLKNP